MPLANEAALPGTRIAWLLLVVQSYGPVMGNPR
jgi:hypothetical protein